MQNRTQGAGGGMKEAWKPRPKAKQHRAEEEQESSELMAKEDRKSGRGSQLSAVCSPLPTPSLDPPQPILHLQRYPRYPLAALPLQAPLGRVFLQLSIIHPCTWAFIQLTFVENGFWQESWLHLSSLGAGLTGNGNEDVRPGTVPRAWITCSVQFHPNRIGVTGQTAPFPQPPSRGCRVAVSPKQTRLYVWVDNWVPGSWRNALWYWLGVGCYVITLLLTHFAPFFPNLQASCVYYHAECWPTNSNLGGFIENTGRRLGGNPAFSLEITWFLQCPLLTNFHLLHISQGPLFLNFSLTN